jgi:lysophospholipase L1-like esterase
MLLATSLLVAAGVAAAGMARTQEASLPEQLQRVHRIVMMGDSITQFGGPPKGYVALVEKTLAKDYPSAKLEVINAGISGEKSTDMHRRFQRDVLDRHPDLVTLSVGVNDVWHDFMTPEWTRRVPTGDSGRGVKLSIYIKEVEAMVSEARAARAKMVLVSPTLIYENLNCQENERLLQYVEAERRIARKHGILFIDLNRAFREAVAAYQRNAGETTLLLTVDGVHMNDQGNALMADTILHALGAAVPDTLKP